MKTLLKKLFFLTLLMSVAQLYAQDKTTLFYDQNGKGLDTKKNAVFYRTVAFDEKNNPTGVVEDFYMNGKPLAKGEAAIIDKFDNNKSRWKGKVQTFTEKGDLQAENNYDESGLLNGPQVTYGKNGLKYEEFEYAHGNPTKDYYITYEKNALPLRYSYLTHLPMKLATSDKVIVPFTDKKIIYQDGIPIQFYFIDGLSVAVKISTKQLYGNYYEAFVTIENGTNDEFDFDPSYITASLEKDGKVFEGEVLLYDDYIKKVKRRQNWTTAFSAFAEAAAATSAGYSSTKVNAYAQTSSGRSVSVQAKSSSYDGAAAYSAAQNASNNITQLVNQQYDIKKNISDGYLKRNTVFANSRLIGFVNIKLEAADHILINVPVNGKVYHFEL
jgi:hypothetical protein